LANSERSRKQIVEHIASLLAGSFEDSPVDVGLDAVSDEGEHRYTAVLDLGVAEETNGGVVGVAPELSVGEAQGIVKVDDGVELRVGEFVSEGG